MKRTLTLVGTLAATGLALSVAGPARANDKDVPLISPSGAVHSLLTWDDYTDTMCLTLKSTAVGATSNADLKIVGSSYFKHLEVNLSKRSACTGNLSIPEDQLATFTIYGGTNTFWRSTSAQAYT